MPPVPENPNIRKGQFLWREEREQRAFIAEIEGKIRRGYYFSDDVLGELVDEIAPAFSDSVQMGRV